MFSEDSTEIENISRLNLQTKPDEENYINSQKAILEKELTNLQDKRKEIESRLRGLNQEIELTKEKLEMDLSPERAFFLRQFRNSETLSRGYVDKALRKFERLAQELKSNPKNIGDLYLEVQNWLENIYQAIRTNKVAFVKRSDYKLSLIEEKYGNSRDVYEYLLDTITEDLCREADNEGKEDLVECIQSLKSSLFRFY